MCQFVPFKCCLGSGFEAVSLSHVVTFIKKSFLFYNFLGLFYCGVGMRMRETGEQPIISI